MKNRLRKISGGYFNHKNQQCGYCLGFYLNGQLGYEGYKVYDQYVGVWKGYDYHGIGRDVLHTWNNNSIKNGVKIWFNYEE